ncbi:MAG: hypothetical protein ACK2UK_21575 [Candidatus Promineifilaceae bacterium]
MSYRKIVVILLAVLATFAFGRGLASPALAQGGTIPTRTPVPDSEPTDEPAPEPTDDNGGGGGGRPDPTDEPPPTDEPGPGPQPATSTPLPPAATAVPPTSAPAATVTSSPSEPTSTATPFVVVPGEPLKTLTPDASSATTLGESARVTFPAGDQPYPEAGPCEMPPTFTTLGPISLYVGPGAAYELSGLLGAGEVRPIVGRAAFVPWWLLQLDATGRVGWALDAEGELHGYISRVAIVSAPELNGVAPTPGGAPWIPIAPEECEGLGLPAAAVAAAAAVVTPPSSKPDSPVVAPTVAGDDSSDIASQAEGSVVSAKLMPGDRSSAADALVDELADTAAPLDQTSDGSSQQLPNLMPIAGAVLILAGVIVALVARRSRAA